MAKQTATQHAKQAKQTRAQRIRAALTRKATR
jgi:hypothetical protein